VVDVVSQEVRTARKEHQCDWCHRTIAKGQPYLYQAVADGGAMYDVKTCQWCLQLLLHHPEFRGRELDEAMFEDAVQRLCQEGDTIADKVVAILGEMQECTV